MLISLALTIRILVNNYKILKVTIIINEYHNKLQIFLVLISQ